MSNPVWLIGTGYIGKEYAKVLADLGKEIIIIGRGEKNAKDFEEEVGKPVVTGGISKFLKEEQPDLPEAAIIGVSIENLAKTTIELIQYGVKNILLEKPGVGHPSEITDIVKAAKSANARVLLAYNRRFYASVIKAKELIEKDGGISSFTFEFTEWSHRIKDLEKHPAEHNNWFLGNSSHVIDTAFFLGGKPKDMSVFVTGENSLNWHPLSSNYTGAGISQLGALFSYHANWEAPGRWVMEFLTKKNRYIFKPIEKLQVQKLGSVAVNPVEEIDYCLDEKYKPGLYLQTKYFLEGQHEELFCDIFEQEENLKYYTRMAGYKIDKK